MNYRKRALESEVLRAGDSFHGVHNATRLSLLEVKATATPMPGDANQLKRVADAIGGRYQSDAFVVHSGSKRYAEAMPLTPGVSAISWQRFKAW